MTNLTESSEFDGLIGKRLSATVPNLPGHLAGELRASRPIFRPVLVILKRAVTRCRYQEGGDMDREEPAVSLRPYVAEMLALETEIEAVLAKMPARLDDYPEASSVVRNLRTGVRRHREKLHQRLLAIGPSSETTARMAPGAEARVATGPRVPQSPSDALRILHGLLNQATFGYAALHAVAHRFFDSRDEGNTADMAENHLREYTQAAQAFNRTISDLAVWELGVLGQECQCKCPSCGLGVCLCSPHGRNTVADVWRETGVAGTEPGGRGIRVRPPRRDSVAGRAGLLAGDFVVAVDDREIGDESWDSIGALQQAIKKHPPGDVLRLRVRRASGDLAEISATRP